MLPVGTDWIHILPAVEAFLRGGNPYLVGEGFHKVYEPFWTYILLAPFALFPFWVGRTLLFIVSLGAFMYTAVRLGATRWQLLLFLSSAAVIGCLNNGNLDWLVTLGLWMPPQIGLFFVLIKPQVGIGIALYWAWASWILSGWKGVVRVFAPVTAAYLLSFLLYGFWIKQLIGMDVNPDNWSGFPLTVLPALLLIYSSARWWNRKLFMFSSPLLAPYTSQFSYSVSLLALFEKPILFVVAWILLWIPVLVRILL